MFISTPTIDAHCVNGWCGDTHMVLFDYVIDYKYKMIILLIYRYQTIDYCYGALGLLHKA